MVDQTMPPDQDSPGGYYEWSKMGRIGVDPSVLDGIEGRAFKVFAPLLGRLPTQYRYQVIYMRRDAGEIEQSQRTMKARRAHGALEELPPSFIARHRAQIERSRDFGMRRVLKMPNATLLVVDFSQLIAHPVRQAWRIATFLPLAPERVELMARLVRPELYRNRLAPTEAPAGS